MIWNSRSFFNIPVTHQKIDTVQSIAIIVLDCFTNFDLLYGMLQGIQVAKYNGGLPTWCCYGPWSKLCCGYFFGECIHGEPVSGAKKHIFWTILIILGRGAVLSEYSGWKLQTLKMLLKDTAGQSMSPEWRRCVFMDIVIDAVTGVANSLYDCSHGPLFCAETSYRIPCFRD